jgi:hypothetical protein
MSDQYDLEDLPEGIEIISSTFDEVRQAELLEAIELARDIKATMPKVITVTTFFCEDDVYFSHDYVAMTIEVDGVEVESYSDDYHEQSRARCEAWVSAALHFYPHATVVEKNEPLEGYQL